MVKIIWMMILFRKQVHLYANNFSLFIGYYFLLQKFQATNQLDWKKNSVPNFFLRAKEYSCVIDFH